MSALSLDLRGHSVFKEHRSGWTYVMDLLKTNFSADGGDGVRFIDFAEKTWGWDWRPSEGVKHVHFEGRDFAVPYELLRKLDGRDAVPLSVGNRDIVAEYDDAAQGWVECVGVTHGMLAVAPKPGVIDEPFVAVFHNPPNMPDWFDFDNSPQTIFTRPQFQQSMENCAGVYVFSDYLRRWLLDHMGFPCPISVIHHPTAPCDVRWSVARYLSVARKPLVQIGYWLRKMSSVYRVDAPGFDKIWLYGGKHAFDCMHSEMLREPCAEVVTEQVDVLRLPDAQYDELLARCVALLDLYDSSCNNGVIECVARHTPLLVNNIPAVVEYLGEDYPLYFNDLEEAARKLRRSDLIVAAHEHMKRLDESGAFSGRAFVEEVRASFVSKKLGGDVRRVRADRIVSLGTDCFPRAILTKLGYKRRKAEGEPTMPFDLAYHPYPVVCRWLEDDFAGFLDASRLSVDGDGLIVDAADGTFYNHESNSDELRERFIPDGYREWKARYRDRIANFRTCLAEASESGEKVVFCMTTQGEYPNRARDAIAALYPSLDFYIVCLQVMWHGQSFCDTLPNVEHGSAVAEENRYCFYNVRRPFKDYLWYDGAHMASEGGRRFEQRCGDIIGRVIEKKHLPG